MKIARVITTWDCVRDCDKCCNRDPKLMSQVRECSIADLQDYDQVLITGGEPMVQPWTTLNTIQLLKKQTPESKQKIYLYTALWSAALKDLVPLLDGIHFTLHYPLEGTDLEGFYSLQVLAGRYADSNKSFRLYIDSRVTEALRIIPTCWARVEVKPWLDECPLPPNEELLSIGGPVPALVTPGKRVECPREFTDPEDIHECLDCSACTG